MTAFSKQLGRLFRSADSLALATVCSLLLLAGCASDKNELVAPEDSMRAIVRQARPQTNDLESVGISSQAQEIEADLGARVPKTSSTAK